MGVRFELYSDLFESDVQIENPFHIGFRFILIKCLDWEEFQVYFDLDVDSIALDIRIYTDSKIVLDRVWIYLNQAFGLKIGINLVSDLFRSDVRIKKNGKYISFRVRIQPAWMFRLHRIKSFFRIRFAFIQKKRMYWELVLNLIQIHTEHTLGLIRIETTFRFRCGFTRIQRLN